MADLKNMNRKQLEKLLKDAGAALSALEAREKREAKKAAEQAAAKFGFSLSDLTGGSPAAGRAKKGTPRKSSAAKSAGKPKYANPENPGQTWTGKGRQPQWYKAAMDAGKDPKSMEV